MSQITDDLVVNGRLTPKYFDPPVGSIGNAAIQSSAQLPATTLRHHLHKAYSQPNTTATTATLPLHVARFAGTVEQLVAGSIAACAGAATITVDLKKNGTSVLTAVITLDSANTARVVESATLDPALVDYVAGDFFELVVTATAGGGTLGTGFHAEALFDEQSQ